MKEQDIQHVAKLSKLSLSQDDLHQFTSQLTDIVHMVERLDEVDTEGVAVTANVVHDINVMREDVAVKGTDRDLLMTNVPEHEDGFIKVPVIIDNGEAGA